MTLTPSVQCASSLLVKTKINPFLQTILKSDEVQFVIIPVFSIIQLDSELKKLEQFKDALRSLIFLNCGGGSIMAGYWFYPDQTDDQPKVTAYIFDSHRPFYHGNVNDSSKCI